MYTRIVLIDTDALVVKVIASLLEKDFDMAEAFEYKDVIYTVVFLLAVFFMGKVAEALKMPSVVGEIITGMILGNVLW